MSTGLVETSHAPSAIDRGVLPTNEVVARVHRIQEVMQALMKKDVHYGTIPGTPKPTLYKPGAELLLVTFRIAASPSLIEDLSTSDESRYRVTMRGTNQMTGEIVGEQVGECSSNEVKYRWRSPVCKEEFDEADVAMRREVWKRGSGGNANYKQQQIRTSPADVANTILKMAVKRAMIALTLSSLAASDIFAQDLEDLAEELRESVSEGETKAEPKAPKRASETGAKSSAAPKAGSAPAPGTSSAFGVVVRVWDSKKPYAVVLKSEDNREAKFSFFDDKLLGDVRAFAGTSHRVRVDFTTTDKNGTTYFNAAAICIADEPKPAAPEPAAAPVVDPKSVSPFERQPGEGG